MKICMGFAALAVCAGACWGQGAGQKIVDRVVEYYSGLKGASVTMALDIEMGDNPMAGAMGDLDQKNFGYAVKPNKFAFWPEDPSKQAMGLPSTAVWSDGKDVICAMPDASVYTVDAAPEDFGKLTGGGDITATNAVWQMIPGADLLFQLMAGDAKDTIGKMLSEAEYQGEEGEGTGKAYVFLATDDAAGDQPMRIKVRIAAEGDPWLLAVEPQFEEANPMMKGVSAEIRFTDWKAIDTPPEEGKIEVADGWNKVDNLLMAAMGNMQQDADSPDADSQGAAEAPAGPGEGTVAPGFSLPTLKGGTFDLADSSGKVVVLDFWATWCGPCVRGLPTVSAVMKDYESKGVVFAAVNLQEDADHVKQFMQDKSWDFPVALDSDGAVAGKFGVNGIPHSVMIDKKGVIRHVHIGFNAGAADEYKQQLQKELDGLLAE